MEHTIRTEVANINMIKELNTLDLDEKMRILEKTFKGDDRWLQWKEDHDSYKYSDRILSEVGKAIVENDVNYVISQMIHEGSPDRHTEPSLALDISIDTILDIKEPEEYDELLRQIRYMVVYDPLLRSSGPSEEIGEYNLEKVLGLNDVGINITPEYTQRFEYNMDLLTDKLISLGTHGFFANLLIYSAMVNPGLAPRIIEIMRDIYNNEEVRDELESSIVDIMISTRSLDQLGDIVDEIRAVEDDIIHEIRATRDNRNQLNDIVNDVRAVGGNMDQLEDLIHDIVRYIGYDKEALKSTIEFLRARNMTSDIIDVAYLDIITHYLHDLRRL